MLEGHLVGLATDAGLLVATEGRMGRVLVVAVGPDAAGLDTTPHAEGHIDGNAPSRWYRSKCFCDMTCPRVMLALQDCNGFVKLVPRDIPLIRKVGNDVLH